VRPRDLVLLHIEAPNDITPLSEIELPPDWDTIPPNDATRAIGTAWAREQKSLCLEVPSVVIPSRSEFNILINPLHRDMPQVKIIERQSFNLDHRVK
jgi:RES domain-containing protein